MKIPFNKPFFDEQEAKLVLASLNSRNTSGDGLYGQRLKEMMSKKLKVKYVLPTPSCTAALELALMSLGIKNGDEVILPSFNFASGAVAILRAGAKPVFADIDKETFCIAYKEIGKAITSKTRAIMIVHYAGHACDMDQILLLAKKYGLWVIEDAAHAIGAKYKGMHLGTIGDVGCYSFHGTKNIVTGEGGAFVTNNKQIFKRAEIMREKGTNRSAFIRGEIDQYSLVGPGSSYLLSDILAAMAIAQFQKLEKITQLRKKHARFLLDKLANIPPKADPPLAEKPPLQLPVVKPLADTNWHIFSFLINPRKREKFIKFLRQKGIEASSHYVPLHSSPLGKKLGWAKNKLPITDMVSKSIVRLPIYPSLNKKELFYMTEKIYEALRKFN